MNKKDFTHFGFKTVPSSEKPELVKNLFNSVSNNYDLMNDLMSITLHRKWKNKLVERVRLKNSISILDVASGTGDLSIRLAKKISDKKFLANIYSLDVTHSMIEIGRDKLVDKGLLNFVNYVNADATKLPIKSRSIDTYIIAFGIRNITEIGSALNEAYRVLKPGGQFLCLEFSKVIPSLEKIYDFYSFKFIPTLGEIIANDRDSYKYLVESIRKFPDQKKYSQFLIESGFEKVKYENLSGGIAAIHSGWRI